MAAGAGEWVRIGTVRRAWGRHGAVRIGIETDWPERRFAPGARVWIAFPGERPEPVTVRGLLGPDRLALEGVESMADAEALAGFEVYARREELDCPGDELRHLDLEDLEVVDTAGRRVGRVEAVEEGVASDLLRVRLTSGGEALVPLAAAICPEIDLDRGRVVIDPPDGLLDPAEAETIPPGREER
jgi:16S rRNA processing protein RimM